MKEGCKTRGRSLHLRALKHRSVSIALDPRVKPGDDIWLRCYCAACGSRKRETVCKKLATEMGLAM